MQKSGGVSRYWAEICSKIQKINTCTNFISGKISKIVYKDVIKDWTYIKKLLFAAIGFIILKIFLYMLAGILMFKTIKEYSNEFIALFSVALLYFSPYSVNAIATYHTYELEFITPNHYCFSFYRHL
jgi:hypothetical protein